jgi:hypothetical protein
VTKAGSNNPPRSLEEIAADIHKVDIRSRAGVFERGRYLIEARDGPLGEERKWKNWVQEEFEYSYSTALNYIKAAELEAKVQRVVLLKIPDRILYLLATDYADDPNRDTIIDALDQAGKSKKKSLTGAVCDDIIYYAPLRLKYPGLPDAALVALNESIPEDAPWKEKAIEAFKKQRPTTEEKANQIVLETQRAHVDALYAPFLSGTMPRWLNSSSLGLLERVPEERRAEIAAKLNSDQPLPGDPEKLHELVIALTQPDNEANKQDDQGGEEEQGEPPETPDSMLPKPGDPAGESEPSAPNPETKETDQAAANEAARAAGDVGGKGEIDRLNAREEEWLREKKQLSNSNGIARREIERLEAEVAKLKSEPKLSIEKLTEALVAALKKVAHEKAEVTVEDLCKKLGIDPHKLNTDGKAKAA